MSDGFVGCDWGTTNLRLRWVDAREGRVLAETASADGVKQAYGEWQRRGGERVAAYHAVLARNLARLEERLGTSLAGAMVVVSGMASSSIGIAELPYTELPFPLAGDALGHRLLDRPLPGGQRVLLLSGVRSGDDVMRGEETQLIGLWSGLGDPRDPSVFVLPGTHSKHVLVEDAAVRGFHTFMTGELFEVAVGHTILRDSVRPTALSAEHLLPFLEGVRDSARNPLLNALFHARTNALFGRHEPADNYWYLSGVLIGAEVGALRAWPGHEIRLGATGELRGLYEAALGELGLQARVVPVPPELVERSAALGQLAVWRRVGES